MDKYTGEDLPGVALAIYSNDGYWAGASGYAVAEYNDVPAYVVYLIQHPLHRFTTTDYLNFIKGKPTQFTPGAKYLYTNTNYEVLALIGDQIRGDHARFIRNSLLAPLGLVNTFYHDNDNYLDKPSPG